MKKLILILIVLIFQSVSLFSQKEYYNWYFDTNFIIFNDDKEIRFLESWGHTEFNTLNRHCEGGTSISDKEGKLLFYTDGTTVWNSKHEIMDNGDGIQGSLSSVNSSMILKKPLSENLYFLFVINENYQNHTTGPQNDYHYYYSIIDMSQNNGFGKVIEKNILLYENVSEFQHAFLKDDCKEYNLFVIQNPGIHPVNQGIQFFTLNNEGKISKIIFDKEIILNNERGIVDATYNEKYDLYIVSHPNISFSEQTSDVNYHNLTLYKLNKNKFNKFQKLYPLKDIKNKENSNLSIGYMIPSICFSPNREYVYFQLMEFQDNRPKNAMLFQYSFDLNGILNYVGKKRMNHTNIRSNIRVGPNGKMYISGDSTLIEIQNPNDYIKSFSVVNHKTPNGKTASFLPKIVDQLVNREPFNIETKDTIKICERSNLLIDFTHDKPYKLAYWTKPDGSEIENGVIYIDSIKKEDEGLYKVVATSDECVEDYDSVFVEVMDYPILADGTTNEICEGESVIFSPQEEYYSYLWSTGETTRDIEVTESGEYELIVSNEFGCSDTTVFTLITHDTPELSITKNSAAECSGEPVELIANADENTSLLWSTGETTSEITVTESGLYSITAISKFGCENYAEIEVEIKKPIEPFEISGIQYICPGEVSVLTPSKDYASYLWSTGETTKEITVDKAGVYSLIATNADGCETQAEFEVFEKFTDVTYTEELIFEPQHIGDINSKDIIITNNSSGAIRFDNIQFNNPYFTINNINDLNNPIEENLILNISYTSNTPAIHNTEITFDIIQPCEYTFSIKLSGTSYAETIFSLSEHDADIGEYLCIPIMARMTQANSPNLNGSPALDFSSRADLYKAETIRTGNIFSENIIEPNRITRFDLQNIELTTEYTQVGEICGYTFLGMEKSTELILSNADWGNDLIYTEYMPGSLSMDNCVYDLRDVILTDAFSVQIMPNPANHQANISIRNAENETNIKLISPTGEIIHQEQITTSINYDGIIDLSEIPSGIYYLHITSGANSETKKLSVVK